MINAPAAASVSRSGTINLVDQVLGRGQKRVQSLYVEEASTLVGAVTVPAPTLNLHAATKLYVDTEIATLAAAAHAAVTIGTANGLSLVGQVLSLAEAGAAQVGAMGTGTQTFAGAKTFSSVLASSVASGSNALTLTSGAHIDFSGAGLYLRASSSTTLRTNGNVTADGTFTSAGSSGSGAFQMGTGQRLYTNGATQTRYFSDSGSAITVTGQLDLSAALTVAGVSNLTGTVTVGTGIVQSQSTASLFLKGTVADGASAVAVKIASNFTYANATAKILSIQNLTTEQAYFGIDGGLTFTGVSTSAGVAISIPGGSVIKFNSNATTLTGSTTGTTISASNHFTAAGTITAQGTTGFVATQASGSTALSVKQGARVYFDSDAGTPINYLSWNSSYIQASQHFWAVSILRGGAVRSDAGFEASAASGVLAYSQKDGARMYFDTALASYLTYSGGFITSNVSMSTSSNFNATGSITAGAVMTSGRFRGNTSSHALVTGQFADGASAYGVKIGNANSLTNATAKILGLFSDDATTERAFFYADGSLNITGAVSGANALTIPSDTRISFNGATASRYLRYNGSTFDFAGAKVTAPSWEATNASGSNAFEMKQGARFITNSATGTRYISDDGTFITFTGPVTMNSTLVAANSITGTSQLATTGLFSASGSAISATVRGLVADGASAVGIVFDNFVSLSNATAKLISARNATTERAFVSYIGGLRTNAANTALPTASASYRGQILYLDSGAGVLDALYVCRKDAADAYAWVAINIT